MCAILRNTENKLQMRSSGLILRDQVLHRRDKAAEAPCQRQFAFIKTIFLLVTLFTLRRS